MKSEISISKSDYFKDVRLVMFVHMRILWTLYDFDEETGGKSQPLALITGDSPVGITYQFVVN